MSLYETLQTNVMVFCVLVAVPVAAVALIRRRVVSPLVAIGLAIILGRGLGFGLAYLGASENASPLAQVAVDYARGLPAYLLIGYACLMQARRYRAARNRDSVRAWFRRAPYAMAAILLISLVGDLLTQPNLLATDAPLPKASFFYYAPRYLVSAAYAAAAAFVFFAAVRSSAWSLGRKGRLQNLFFGVALLGTALLSLHVWSNRGLKAFLPEVAAQTASLWTAAEIAIIVLQVGGLAAGILSYYAQSKRSRFLERFIAWLDIVADLTEELSNAPIAEEKTSVPYMALREASGEEFLGLSASDRRRADNAFCAKLVWERTGDAPRGRSGRLTRLRITELARAYDEEAREPVLAQGLRQEAKADNLPDIFENETVAEAGGDRRRGMGETLMLIATVKGRDGGLGLTTSPEWEQLVNVAAADAGLLPKGETRRILDGDAISERVLNAYRLAQYKIRKYGHGLPGDRRGLGAS